MEVHQDDRGVMAFVAGQFAGCQQVAEAEASEAEGTGSKKLATIAWAWAGIHGGMIQSARWFTVSHYVNRSTRWLATEILKEVAAPRSGDRLAPVDGQK